MSADQDILPMRIAHDTAVLRRNFELVKEFKNSSDMMAKQIEQLHRLQELVIQQIEIDINDGTLDVSMVEAWRRLSKEIREYMTSKAVVWESLAPPEDNEDSAMFRKAMELDNFLAFLSEIDADLVETYIENVLGKSEVMEEKTRNAKKTVAKSSMQRPIRKKKKLKAKSSLRSSRTF